MRSGIVNTLGFGGTQVLNLKQAAKNAGWTVPRSSDGITHNPTGDIITTHSQANGTAGNISNANAWFVMRDPDGRRSLCFQRGTGTTSTATDHQWRVKLAVNNNQFVLGSPSATQVPSANLEQPLIGSGTDAAPTFDNWFQANTPNVYGHAIFDDTPIGNVYPMHFYCVRAGTAVVGGTLLMEPLQVGSYSSAEIDPAVYMRTLDGVAPTAASNFWWYGLGTGSQLWKTTGSLNLPGNVGVSTEPTDIYGYDYLTAYLYTDASSPTKKKGMSSFFRNLSSNKLYPSIFNTTTDARVAWGASFTMPFLNNTQPSI